MDISGKSISPRDFANTIETLQKQVEDYKTLYEANQELYCDECNKREQLQEKLDVAESLIHYAIDYKFDGFKVKDILDEALKAIGGK